MVQPLMPAQLVEVVRADRRRRWQQGDRVLAETYLQRYPALQADTNLAVELVYHEVLLREELGEAFTLDEYLQRFPQLTAQLEPLFEVHRALGPGGLFDTPASEEPKLLTPQLARPPEDLLWPEVPGYEIIDCLGKGGMGVVYRARDRRLGREVALKLMAADAVEADRARFRAEAEAQARLQHPHIVQIYEVGEDAGRPYLALEYLAGGSLDKQLAGKPQAAAAAASLVETLARAVHSAHQRGLVHRDLKPANVLLTADGIPKVSDFGLAKRWQQESGLTRSGEIVGTPSYMAPEQAAPRPTSVGPAADVYALGAILYEMLTGRPPFLAETVLDTLLQVRHLDPVPPRHLQPKVPRDLETICLNCLRKEPRQRYASAIALADDLRRFQQGEAIAARPVGLGERAVKWARRRPELAALLLALAAVIAGSLLGLTALWWRADEQRAQVVAEKARADEEAEVAEAVNDFLQKDLLLQAASRGQADHRFTPDPDVRVRTLLDRAANGIGERFRDRPRVAAAIRAALGEAYLGVGEPEQAVRHLNVAEALFTAQFGSDHPRTRGTFSVLAAAYLDAGRASDAVQLLEQLRARLIATLGPDHPDTLNTHNTLAAAYLAAGRDAEAITLFEQVRAQRTHQLGPDHPDTLVTLNSLAEAYRSSGRVAEAIKLLEQGRALQARQSGPDHPFTLTMGHNLGGAYLTAGRTAEAIQLLEQVRTQEVQALGPEHPHTLATLNTLAAAYSADGRTAEAIRLYEQLRDHQTRKLGADHPATLNTLNNLATAFLTTGRPAEAVRLLEHVRARQTRTPGPDHPSTLVTLSNLGNAYRAVGRTAEAIELFEQVRARRTQKLGPDHPDTLAALHHLGSAYRDVGCEAEAIRVLEHVRAQRIQQLGASHPNTLSTSNNLALTYAKVGRSAEAIQLFQETRELLTKTLGPDHPQTLNTLDNLASALHAAKQFDQAQTVYRELLDAKVRLLPVDHPATAETRVHLGRCLLSAGKPAEAEPLLRDGLAIWQKRQPDLAITFDAQVMLGTSLAAQQKYAEAEPLLVVGYEGMKQRQDQIPAHRKRRLSEAVEQLEQFYHAWGKPEKAAYWRAEREKLPKPPEPPKAK